MLKAALFDLDDTLFDHTASARAGLRAWQAAHPSLAATPLGDLERAHSEKLEAAHLRVLAGELTVEEARTVRTRDVFAAYGMRIEASEAAAATRTYRDAYETARGPVPGCVEILRLLEHEHGLRLGVVTNNVVHAQMEKLDLLGLRTMFDELVISEAVGVTKPDPRIYEIALERLGVEARDAVMVGDSLVNDVEAAERAGLRAVWLDRHGTSDGTAPRAVIRGWTPAREVVRAIVGGAAT